MAESFELSDEASGLAFGVSATEVVPAQIAVDLAGVGGRRLKRGPNPLA